MITALLFDFDGLILDTETPEVIAWQEVYARYGVEFPVNLWGRIVGGNGGQDFDPVGHLAEKTGLPIDRELMRADKRVRDRQLVAEQPVLPGVQDYFEDAKRLGLKLAIASSSTHDWVDNQLKRLGLFDYFDNIICREDVQRVKPDPQLFLTALAATGAPPDQALVFEDSPNGIKAGKAAGIRTVGVPNPVTATLGPLGADLTLASLADLSLPGLLRHFGDRLEIRPESEADIAGVRAVEEAAFGRPAEADLVDRARSRGRVVLSLVAAEEKVVGHVLFTPLTLDGHPDVRGLGLGPVAVLPSVQKTGIGSRLMRAGLDAVRRAGYDYVVLLGDPAYYSRFGFRPGRTFGLDSDYGDGEAFQAVELRPEALAGCRGRVHYIPEFEETGC